MQTRADNRANATSVEIGDWRDRVLLYGAATAALILPPVTWGIATDDLSTGSLGALLAVAGAMASLQLSRRRVRTMAPSAILLGMLAMGIWWLVLSRAEKTFTLNELFGADPGMAMAQRMCLLMIGLSFCMVRPGLIGLALVPGITVFGLASGRVDPLAAGLLFSLYLMLTMVVLAWGMLSPLETRAVLGAETGGPQTIRGKREWRSRHLLSVGVAFLICAIVGYGLSVPLSLFADLYRWPLLIAMTPAGGERMLFGSVSSLQNDQFAVGTGPQPLSSTPILAVSGEAPSPYWRGLVYDQYTGSSWARWQRPQTVPLKDGVVDVFDHLAIDQSSLPPDVETRSYRVRCRIRQPFVIYAPGQIMQVILPPGRQHPLALDPLGCVTEPSGFLAADDTYEVVVAPLESAAPPLPRNGEPGKLYLSVPISASRVAHLAHEIAGDKPTPRAKLDALVAYLQNNLVYDLNAPPVPRGRDAADYFLFDLKRGKCDLFATALAVMARAEGIPTRLATGFLGGKYDPESGLYLLRDCDRHAWVEAYLPREEGAAGPDAAKGAWVIVDPTPGVEGKPAVHGWKLLLLRIRFFGQDHAWALPAGAAAIFIAALVIAFLPLLSRRRAQYLAAANDPRSRVSRAYRQFLSMLRKRGFPRRPTQTPLEYLAALRDAVRAHSEPGLSSTALSPAAALTGVFVAARYGRGPVSEQQAEEAAAALEELAAALDGRRGGP